MARFSNAVRQKMQNRALLINAQYDTTVNEMFSGSWQALGSRARVEKVYKVIVSQDDLARKIAYRYVSWSGTLNESRAYRYCQ